MYRPRLIALAVALLLVASAVAPAPVAADEDDDGVIGDLLDDDDDSWFDRGLAYANGLIDRYLADSTDESAQDAANSFGESFRANSTHIQAWVNNRTKASTEANVLEVTFAVGGTNLTRYVVADVNNSTGDYKRASVVATTDRPVDEACTLSGDAARNADEEVDRFVREFAKPGKNVTGTYLAGLAGRYGDSVECSFTLER